MTTIEKIKAEIEQSRYGLVNDGLDLALKIIDKYAEQEPTIGQLFSCEEVEELRNKIWKQVDQEPCVDVISRQAVFDLMRSLKRWCVRSEDGKFNNVGLLYDDVMFGIEKLPPVRPQEPKTGHWIKCKNDYECSECGGRNGWHYDYCHDCGAKMVEPRESEDK